MSQYAFSNESALPHSGTSIALIDDDAQNRRFDGLLGVQVHVGPPMKIEYRSFRLKHLPERKL